MIFFPTTVEVVVGLTGAIAGSTVGFIFPALAFLYSPKSRSSLSLNKIKSMVNKRHKNLCSKNFLCSIKIYAL